ncbi:hypothetical protein BU23DRAFT_575995 [Bimuria novae-zelandiae CBS 107.79]|uniref:Uncharacterized protein n=1 Tax=Bimuria novae-zelandiae CBS 107.79 TaxID=1447943 RepID=A0A6A5UJ87_9PLEO|nr:hypothetical protein BU23DRAFT_575995 [Bimuria novae-zelandiae CBS 107.79]
MPTDVRTEEAELDDGQSKHFVLQLSIWLGGALLHLNFGSTSPPLPQTIWGTKSLPAVVFSLPVLQKWVVRVTAQRTYGIRRGMTRVEPFWGQDLAAKCSNDSTGNSLPVLSLPPAALRAYTHPQLYTATSRTGSTYEQHLVVRLRSNESKLGIMPQVIQGHSQDHLKARKHDSSLKIGQSISTASKRYKILEDIQRFIANTAESLSSDAEQPSSATTERPTITEFAIFTPTIPLFATIPASEKMELAHAALLEGLNIFGRFPQNEYCPILPWLEHWTLYPELNEIIGREDAIVCIWKIQCFRPTNRRSRFGPWWGHDYRQCAYGSRGAAR